MLATWSFRTNIVDARSLYVAVSRARDKTTIYTDDRDKLTFTVGLRSGSQVAALDQDIGGFRHDLSSPIGMHI